MDSYRQYGYAGYRWSDERTGGATRRSYYYDQPVSRSADLHQLRIAGAVTWSYGSWEEGH